MRGLEGRLAEQNTVARDDPHTKPFDAREPADDRRAVERLELAEARAIHQPCDHFVHVVLGADVAGDERVEVLRIVRRRLRVGAIVDAPVRWPLQLRDDVPSDSDRVRVVEREVIGYAGHARVDVGPAELLGRDVDTGRGLHERRSTDEDRALALHDDRLVAHRGHIRAARG